MRRFAGPIVAAAVLLPASVWGVEKLTYEDDRAVDPATPGAQRAIQAAREVVVGSVRGVARDEDNGKWEVTIAQDGRDYEVELDAATLHLLRVDYD